MALLRRRGALLSNKLLQLPAAGWGLLVLPSFPWNLPTGSCLADDLMGFLMRPLLNGATLDSQEISGLRDSFFCCSSR